MGWREEEVKASRMKEANDARQEDLNNFDFDFGVGSRTLNAIGLFGGTTGEDKFPGVEPEDTWISEVDTLPINNKSFSSFITKSVRSMSRYEKFRDYPLEKKQTYVLQTIYQFRPSILSALGLV